METEGSLPQSQVLYLTVSQHDALLLWGVVSTSSNPQARGLPLVGCPWLLIQYIHIYPSYWRPFVHSQPEKAPCRGDRDPYITVGLEMQYLLSQRFDSTTSSHWISVIFNLHYFGFLQSLVFVLFQEITETKGRLGLWLCKTIRIWRNVASRSLQNIFIKFDTGYLIVAPCFS